MEKRDDEMDDNNSSLKSTTFTLDALPKLSLAILGIIYLFGFLVVMFNLSQYGVSPVGLLRIQYLVAGVWSLTPIFISYMVIVAIYWFISPHLNKPDKRETRLNRFFDYYIMIYATLSFVFVLLIILFFFFSLFLPDLGIKGSFYFIGQNWNMVMIVSSFSMIIGFLVKVAWEQLHFLLYHDYQKDSQHHRRVIAGILFSLCSTFLFIIAYMAYFSLNVYSKIPHGVGGGRPLLVQFLLNEGEDMKHLPIVADESGKKSIPYRLVLRTDKMYVIAVDDENRISVHFNRENVLGMEVLKETRK